MKYPFMSYKGFFPLEQNGAISRFAVVAFARGEQAGVKRVMTSIGCILKGTEHVPVWQDSQTGEIIHAKQDEFTVQPLTSAEVAETLAVVYIVK